MTFTAHRTIQINIIEIINDNVIEGNEEFYATLITTDSGVVIRYPFAILHIIENDSESTLITNYVSVFTIFS